jgi:hypothetical protein
MKKQDAAKSLSINELLAQNPHIDRVEFARVVEAIARLRAMGLSRPEYRLSQPFRREPGPTGFAAFTEGKISVTSR